jgi:hypothetical protein
MSLDITGIRNVGDFYSQHYLDTLLASDLQATLQAWSLAETEGGAKSPPKRLASLANAYFKAAARATGDPDPVTRLEEARAFHADLIDALGYYRSPGAQPIEDNLVVPTVVEVLENGRPFLWAVEAPFPEDPDEADPLSECPLPEQLPEAYAEAKLPEASWKELLDGAIFRQDHPPRWILLLAGGDVFLIDRNKWPQGKYLHFELGALMGRRDPKAMRAMAGLLHRDVLLPDAGQSILDKLDEQSHKHAFAVSTDLKFGVQQAIEILANEALFHKRTVSKEKLYGDPELAKQLTRECIVYLYRMLFLFYVEARGQELGVVPMGADPYRLGYSLESLRDLELVPLTTVQAREGFFLDDSLRKLFRLVQRGFGTGQRHIDAQSQDAVEAFRIPALRSALFDEARTPFLRGVKLRTAALQRVLQLLSLSKEGGKERGRISYAQLGINQLGAVYEGLLSYSGFFAQEDLYEVQAAGSTQKSDVQSYFVSAAKIGEYHDDEIVKDSRNRPVLHKRGTYLFRLAGRDREKSASYYTPEVLTACLTKYTLKERLGESIVPRAEGEPEPKLVPADEILKLTICEPAMGSGAFLNEAINQLAHKYLERKQAELGLRIPAEDYQREWLKVKYHFAVNNAYGVDLNPLATELGKVSSWLNVLQPDVDAPYFDLRLRVGNSLIGARREVFDAADLMVKASKKTENWLSKVPVKVPLGTERKPRQIYHFLVPDAGMAPFDRDKVIAELEPENVKRIKAWRKSLGQPFTAMDVKRLDGICDRIDALWNAHHKQRVQVLASVRQHLSLWGQPEVDRGAFGPRDAETCEETASVLREPGASGQVLKTILDYWCSLWFWPIRAAAYLPSRDEWMGDVEALLDRTEGGEKRLEVVKGLAEDKRFFHWELEFPEVFWDGGGMDVILGNPPWRKVEWQEAEVLADFEPTMTLRKLSAKGATDLQSRILKGGTPKRIYLHEFEEGQAGQSFLGGVQNYVDLGGIQSNLYKCFLHRCWQVGAPKGTIGLFHQPGLFDDPKAGQLRLGLYQRLIFCAIFRNELKLFSDIGNVRPYSLTVSRCSASEPLFTYIANVLHPKTIDQSIAHDNLGQVPAIKLGGDWDLRGHRSRLVQVDRQTLKLFAQLYDAPNTPAEKARLPIVHSREILNSLRRFAEVPRRLADLGTGYFCSEHFHETNQQKDGTIKRETGFPESAAKLVVSGPHFHVGSPINKSPNVGCSSHRDYSSVDLTVIPSDYLPRTNYVPTCSEAEYRKRTPQWKGRPVTEFYRHVHREMVAPTGERTLVGALIPPGTAHIHTVFSMGFGTSSALLSFHAMALSLPVDFFVKSTGMGHVNVTLAGQLPCTFPPRVVSCAHIRALRLNCLATPYAPLWEDLYDAKFRKDTSANPDPRAGTYKNLTKTWNRDVAFRTPYARRQALVELDALAALSLKMTLDELLLIYRVQFPVLQQYERETYYDQRGKIVFTVNKGLSGVGLSRKEWEQVQDAKAGEELPDWAHDQQGPFVPPFDKCDREHDMAQAYEHFSKVLKEGAS